jgi:p-aminobenzoyl-glutamate transporter AbgT
VLENERYKIAKRVPHLCCTVMMVFTSLLFVCSCQMYGASEQQLRHLKQVTALLDTAISR